MAYLKMHEVLGALSSHGSSVFTINDAARIMGKPKGYVSKLLSSNKGVKRIERGKYYLAGSVDIYGIASQIVFPSYVSMFAALQFHSLTEQSVVRYSVVTIRRHRSLAVNGNAIEFVTFGKERFFGYKKYGNAYIATVEKAIADSLYMRSPPVSYVEEAFSEAVRRKAIDIGALSSVASRMASKRVEEGVRSLLGGPAGTRGARQRRRR